MHDLDSLRAAAVPLQRRVTLELLSRAAAVTRDGIPAVWPLSRAFVSAVVKELVEAGAIRRQWDMVVPGRETLAITPAGRTLLATLDDDAMQAAIAAALAARPPVAG